MQAVQVDGLRGETLEGVERFQEYGFTSHPHPDAEVLLLAVGGMRQHSIAAAVADRRYRLRQLAQGEVAMFTDEDEFARVGRFETEGGRVVNMVPDASLRHRIILKRGRIAELWAGETMLRLSPAGVEIVSPSLTHNGVNIGDDHAHSGVTAGSSNTGPPV